MGSRRQFLTRLGAAGSILGIGGLLTACGQAATPAAPVSTANTPAPAGAGSTAASASKPATGGAAGTFPARPIDYIVPWGAGGGADQLARTTAPLLEKQLGASLPVLNVPGATGGTGMAKLLAAPADGYALAVYIADSNAVVAAGSASWGLADLAPVARMMKVPSFLFVKAGSPYQTFDDLEQAVKSRPNELKAATLGKASVDETTLAFMASKGFKVTQVPFAQPGERYSSILGDNADLLYEQAGDVGQFLTNKQMRPLLIFNETRLDAFADVPTSREKGYEIFLPQFRGIVARAGAPDAVIQKLSDAFKVASEAPEMQTFAKTQYMTPDSFQPAAQFKTFLDQETATMEKLMRDLGLRA